MKKERKMKKVLFPILAVVLALSLALPMAAVVGAATINETYQSDTTDMWWSGATSSDIVSGYIVPPDGTWSSAVLCWEHTAWNPGLNPSGYKSTLFASPAADWIWKAYQVTNGEAQTGDIVFFKKGIDIPANAVNIQADLYITTDNGYYFYVNNPSWSGTTDGQDGFGSGYGPTNFYYVADGTNISGGADSTGSETIDNVYPLEAGVITTTSVWQGIEHYDVSGDFSAGTTNVLQIVAMNEHGAPSTPTDNPAGLIYKLTVTYEEPSIEVEKDYRYTNVCFERDNDLDGKFNEDPVNFEIDGVTPIDDDDDGLFNEDDVDCPLGTDLGARLPMDNGNYVLEAVIHPKNNKVSSYNPGQYYAVSTVTVLDDVGTLTIMEDWDDCDEISTLNPKNGGGAVVIVQVGGEINGEPVPDPLAAYQILDATSDAVTVSGNTATAVLEDVKAGTTILMYVKFGPGLKGETWDPPNGYYGPCENYNWASVLEVPDPTVPEDWIEASAWLKVIEKE